MIEHQHSRGLLPIVVVLVALGVSGGRPAFAQPFKLDQFKADPGRAMQEATPAGDSLVIDGRVLPREGELLSGTGQFKFVLYRRDANGALRQVWNSAQGVASGVVGEPPSAIGVPVRAGRYSLTLGDGSLTPRLPRLSSPIPLPTPYVRVWLRDPDGVFRVVGPDLPVDATPLAREAALAGDADRLGGRPADYFLNRANHRGPEPMVEFVHVYNPSRSAPVVGCGELKVELNVDAPGDGVLVILGHANIVGVVRAGGGNCGRNEKHVEVCPSPIPNPGDLLEGLPPPPDPPSPGGGLPSVTLPTPSLPSLKPPKGPSFRAAGSARGLPAPPCIAAEFTTGGASRTDTMGGRGSLYLFRRDLESVELQTLSRTGIEFQPDVLTGRRMDVSATIAVQRGRIKLEMIGYNASTGGIGEHNLTAMFFPARR
jgi:hypothetical protein